jgi:hypothetical protein
MPRACKPVFAFLVDPKAPWTEVKEQDRLVSEPEKAAEIFKAVQKLQEFKAYLERGVRQMFTSAEELAKLAAITALELCERLGHGRVEETRRALESMTGRSLPHQAQTGL